MSINDTKIITPALNPRPYDKNFRLSFLPTNASKPPTAVVSPASVARLKATPIFDMFIELIISAR